MVFTGVGWGEVEEGGKTGCGWFVCFILLTKGVGRVLYMLGPSDGLDLDLWVYNNKGSVWYYSEQAQGLYLYFLNSWRTKPEIIQKLSQGLIL